MIDALELLKTAIRTKSVSGQETEVATYLSEQMASFCEEAFVDMAGNAVGKLGTGPLNVYFLGHIDTVPGDIEVRVEDGKLYGRGSVDAKGSFCTAVAAASRLGADTLSKLSLTLIGATEEEAPSSKGARHALSAYEKPDFVIIGEPSAWDALTLGYKGRLVAKLRVVKDNFHSAGEGTTAAEDVVAAWNTLHGEARAFNADKEGIFSTLQIALQSVSSNADGLEQTADAAVGYRLPPGLAPDALKQQVSALLDDAVQITFTGAETAYRSERDTPLSRAFRIAVREHGGKPRFKVKTGTSDMNVVAPLWNVPMLAYGPGDSALDHTPNEHLSLEEYEKAVAVLATALERLVK